MVTTKCSTQQDKVEVWASMKRGIDYFSEEVCSATNPLILYALWAKWEFMSGLVRTMATESEPEIIVISSSQSGSDVYMEDDQANSLSRVYISSY